MLSRVILLSVLVPLVTAAAGSGDYELKTVPPAPEPICAKSWATCQDALAAARDFGLFADLRVVEMACVRHPGCFSAQSLCIRAYSC